MLPEWVNLKVKVWRPVKDLPRECLGFRLGGRNIGGKYLAAAGLLGVERARAVEQLKFIFGKTLRAGFSSSRRPIRQGS